MRCNQIIFELALWEVGGSNNTCHFIVCVVMTARDTAIRCEQGSMASR